MVITEANAVQINKFLGKKTVKAGEFFYVPINGKTLADLKNEQGYLIPGKLFDPENTKRNEYTSGKHNSWSFSFRLIDDANPDEFLIESYLAPYSSIGSWMGSWIKMYGRCPVVNYIDGEHGSIEGYGLRYDNVMDGEVFKLTPTSEGPGVANEEVSVSSVKVTAKEGAISIVGAANKKVNVVNVLGQTIASQILSSDNETISAPAGVVVVSVEGEETVKAIVK
ncbi:MAG: DUF6383 domain-containing protein [Clostridiales bacterium]|nr:DUF6383 domain-containing protein [Clostridiales bacterium]